MGEWSIWHREQISTFLGCHNLSPCPIDESATVFVSRVAESRSLLYWRDFTVRTFGRGRTRESVDPQSWHNAESLVSWIILHLDISDLSVRIILPEGGVEQTRAQSRFIRFNFARERIYNRSVAEVERFYRGF